MILFTTYGNYPRDPDDLALDPASVIAIFHRLTKDDKPIADVVCWGGIRYTVYDDNRTVMKQIAAAKGEMLMTYEE